VADWEQLALGPVEVRGTVRPLELLEEPIDGTRCVVVAYRAWPPSTTIGVDGSSMVGDRAFQLSAQQSVEFTLESGGQTLLVRPLPSEDVTAKHRELQDQYGIGLRAEVRCVMPGDTVVVRGRIVHLGSSGGSPHRLDPYRAVLAPEQIRVD
jgi:hypothetical protein